MPATTIYYFSATGNSLVAARTIAEKLGNTKLIHMAHQDAANSSPDSSKIGLIFPVYIFGLPLIVTRFIEKLRIPSDSYLFAVATHGGMPCATLTQVARLFSEQGIKLSSGFEVLMVDNATMIADTIPPEKQKVRFEKSKNKINKICTAIEKRKQIMYRGWPLVNWLFSKIYRGAAPDIPGFDKHFSVDSNCNGCGVCGQVCPMDNIKMIDSRPVWQHHCEQCLACFHWCPAKAVQYGEKTAGRTRYHHPDVKINDIIVQRQKY